MDSGPDGRFGPPRRWREVIHATGFGTMATASLLVFLGCSRTYDYRIERTVESLKYEKRLNDNLMPAATKGKFHELLIYLRPPKNLKASQEFHLPSPEPGRFDLEQSFQESAKQSLHVLARVKRPKIAKKKKETSEKAAARGDFGADVLAVLNSASKPAEEVVISKFKPVEKKRTGSSLGNEFQYHIFSSNNKTVQVYFYKKEPYDVVLVFEYPISEHGNLQSKITLCLESFAVGEKARDGTFSGGGGRGWMRAGARQSRSERPWRRGRAAAQHGFPEIPIRSADWNVQGCDVHRSRPGCQSDLGRRDLCRFLPVLLEERGDDGNQPSIVVARRVGGRKRLGGIPRGVFEALEQLGAEDRDVVGCLDPEADLVALQLHDRDLDLRTDHDPLRPLPTQDQHRILHSRVSWEHPAWVTARPRDSHR